MKKHLLLFFVLSILTWSAYSQNQKCRVAVAFNTDTTFSVIESINVKSLNFNLNNSIYSYLSMIADTNSFILKQEDLPYYMRTADRAGVLGIPAKYQFKTWFKESKLKDKYDLLLIFYKPIQNLSTYSYLNGFSYGMSSNKGIVFSLCDALVMDLKTLKVYAATSIQSEGDFIAGEFTLNKLLPYDHIDNISKPLDLIDKLNQSFAVKAYQCLLASKSKMSGR